MSRRIRKWLIVGEGWSGVPLRWMLRRLGYAAGIAALAGITMSVTVTAAHYYSDEPPVVIGAAP